MRPVFITRNVSDNGFSRIVKESHIKFVLKQDPYTFTGIGFNLAEKFSMLQRKLPLDIVYNIDATEWNGEQMLQLKIVDFNIAEAHLK
jgi:single-stranded-DNA-specific exonuclease